MPTVETIYYSTMESPIGKLLVAASELGLRYVYFDKISQLPQRKGEVWIKSPEKVRAYEDQLRAYFRGELREFTCKLDLVGTQFQKDCWNALLRIPYGATCSYGDIAREIGRPQAFRAVGMANHDNPIPIIVPCHRVLGANGTLTGYGGGLPTKEKLLRLEGASFQLKPRSEKHAGNEAGVDTPSAQARFEY